MCQEITAWVKNMSLNINDEDVPKSRAAKQQNKQQVDKTTKNKIAQVDLD